MNYQASSKEHLLKGHGELLGLLEKTSFEMP
jgi:hypothetical protein